MGHPINGYLPMPTWCTVQPDSSVREPPKEQPRALLPSSGNGAGQSKKGGSGSEFYSGSSPEYSSEDESESEQSDSASESESSSESSSGSVSESESGSESESTSEDKSGSSVGSRSSSASSSDGSSSSGSESSASKGEEGVGLLIMVPGASNTPATYGASAPAPQSQDLTGLVERLTVEETEGSAPPQLELQAGGLGSLSMDGVRKSMPVVGGIGKTQLSARASSIISDSGANLGEDVSVSFPVTLLRHQTGGGLQVEYQYSRGRANVVSRPSTSLVLQLTLINHRETPICRISVVAPRDGTPMDRFREIQVLEAGASVSTKLGIDFGGSAKQVKWRTSQQFFFRCSPVVYAVFFYCFCRACALDID